MVFLYLQAESDLEELQSLVERHDGLLVSLGLNVTCIGGSRICHQGVLTMLFIYISHQVFSQRAVGTSLKKQLDRVQLLLEGCPYQYFYGNL